MDWACDILPRDDLPDHRKQTLAAIKSMGTNGLQYLVKMLGAPSTGLKNRLISLVNGQQLIHLHIRTVEEKRIAAFVVLVTIEADRQMVVPQLIDLIRNQSAKVRNMALNCLVYINPSGGQLRVLLIECLRDPDAGNRNFAVRMIRLRFPEEAKKLGLPETDLPTTTIEPPDPNPPNQ